MKNMFILCGLALVSAACTRQSPLEKFSWIQGSWQSLGEEVQYYETWKKVSDSLYSGIGYVMSEGDTVFREDIKLLVKDKDIYYIPVVEGQNNELPVSFKFSGDSSGTFLFVNPEHDFPQRIGYANPAPDSLYAFIEGNHKGKYRKEEFPMSRKK